jgi:hypothetical protein
MAAGHYKEQTMSTDRQESLLANWCSDD